MVRRFYLGLSLMGILFCVWPSAWAAKVLVLLSKDLPAYRQVADGYTGSSSYEIQRINLADDADQAQTLSLLASGKIDLLVTIGPQAAELGKERSAIPWVYTMVLDAPAAPGARSGGVMMRVDLSDQVVWLKKLFPQGRQVSVIYNPAYSLKLINRARTLAEQNQLTLLPMAVESAEEVSGALQKIRDAKIDVLWSVVDSTILQPQVISEIIEFTDKNRIPFVGLSETHVKAGALATISVDYSDLGAQCADLSVRLQRGSAGGMEPARRLVIYVNPSVQKSLGLQAWSQFPEVRPIE
jgi:putative tryptophan/tyrosine transport system substrate-binding protein